MNLLKDLDVGGKRVFVRADLDVPIGTTNDERLTTKAETEQATRLTNLKPTVDYLVEKGAKQVIIAGHIDRPQGPDPSKSTKQLLGVLEKILGREIGFNPDPIGHSHGNENLDSRIRENDKRELVLLENLRFWSGETENDPGFAKILAKLADVYVNEAFGNSHREHASMVALPLLLPHAAGLHLEKEVEVMTKLLEAPQRPFVSIVGGAKLETKLPVIQNLAKISHHVLVGGELPLEIKKLNIKYKTFPSEIQNDEGNKVIVAELTEDGKDINLESAHTFVRFIKEAKTIVWNGPMGLFEEGHDVGSKAVANAILESGAYGVVGGGETTQFLEKENLLSRFSFVSAGGGAMLEFLAGKELPGIEALD